MNRAGLPESGDPKPVRLAHGWQLMNHARVSGEVIRDFMRPAVRAVPRSAAERVGPCRISLIPQLGDPDLTSQWISEQGLISVRLVTKDTDPHDLALELLFCVGQVLWENLEEAERAAWLKHLSAEFEARVAGEIDEDTLREKRALLSGGPGVPNRRRVEKYASASFASTLSELVHALWHDVTVRTGPEHLPAEWLRRRLKMIARFFPPDRGYRLFPHEKR